MNASAAIEDTKRLILKRRYKAPRELVWKVWTDPEHVAKWWGPFGPEETSAKIDAAVGGIFFVAMTAPDGSKHPSRGEIKQIDPPRRLVIEGDANAPDDCGAGLPPRALIILSLDEVDGETLLTLDAHFPSMEAREAAETGGYATSWNATLDALAPFIEILVAAQR